MTMVETGAALPKFLPSLAIKLRYLDLPGRGAKYSMVANGSGLNDKTLVVLANGLSVAPLVP
jgi:hypothetical protein